MFIYYNPIILPVHLIFCKSKHIQYIYSLTKREKEHFFACFLLTCIYVNETYAPKQRGKTPTPNGATHDAWGQNPGSWAVLYLATEWSHDLQYTTLAPTGLDRWSDQPSPINQLVMSSLSTYIFSPDSISIAPVANTQTGFQGSPFDLSIPVLYPRLNQGKRVPPFC